MCFFLSCLRNFAREKNLSPQSGHLRFFENLSKWHLLCLAILSGFPVQKGQPTTWQNIHLEGGSRSTVRLIFFELSFVAGAIGLVLVIVVIAFVFFCFFVLSLLVWLLTLAFGAVIPAARLLLRCSRSSELLRVLKENGRLRSKVVQI